MIFGDQGQSQIDTGRDTSRGIELAVADIDRVDIQFDLGEFPGDGGGKPPMGGGPPRIHESCLGQGFQPGANRNDAARVTGACLQEGDNRIAASGIAQPAAARHQDGVEGGRFAKRHVGGHAHAGLTMKHLARGANGAELIGLGPQHVIGGGKNFQGPEQVQGRDIVIADKGDVLFHDPMLHQAPVGQKRKCPKMSDYCLTDFVQA